MLSLIGLLSKWPVVCEIRERAAAAQVLKWME